MVSIPNALTLSRIAVTPLLFVAAWLQSSSWFAGLFFWALLSDVLDGPLARLLHQQSTYGGMLDSIADAALFLTAPLAAMWLYPWVRGEELGTFAVIVAGYALPIAFGFARFGRLTSYHTVGAKLAAWVLSISFFAMIVFETAWPLRMGAGVLALAALEEMAISAVVPAWQPNIPTLWHALRSNRFPNPSARPLPHSEVEP